jgi:hypothetical protein
LKLFQFDLVTTNIGKTMKPITKKIMRLPATLSCNILWLFALCVLDGELHAQTILSGPNLSGTLSPSGNPYIVAASLTVASGQTLTVEPGVVLEIGPGLSITANGLIQAVGTPSQHITFQSPVTSEFWNAIICNDTTGANVFEYCDFSNANTALTFLNNSGAANNENEVLFCSFQNVTNGITMGVYNAEYQVNMVMSAQILNCSFSNCFSLAIYGEAQGQTHVGAGNDPCFIWGSPATLNPLIENCVFIATGNGCVMKCFGEHATSCNGGVAYAYGYGYPIMMNNIFSNLTGTACLLQVGSYPGGGSPLFQNNTIVNCSGGVSATDPWNATYEGNVFVGVTNALTDSGSGTLSQQVSYNALYKNATNFIGYNTNIYGNVIIANRNGTPCDLLYNIYQNPLFASATNCYLATNSPCVNAGPPGQALENMCFPPSIGTNFNDMGAYGGPDACNWLNVVPIIPAQTPSLSTANGLFSLNWYAVPRSTYQIQYATNQVNGSNYWQNLTNSQTEALGTPWSLSVAPYPPTNKMQFYRIQSLGRTPGN